LRPAPRTPVLGWELRRIPATVLLPPGTDSDCLLLCFTNPGYALIATHVSVTLPPYTFSQREPNIALETYTNYTQAVVPWWVECCSSDRVTLQHLNYWQTETIKTESFGGNSAIYQQFLRYDFQQVYIILVIFSGQLYQY